MRINFSFVPYRWVLLGGGITLALCGLYVHQLGASNILEALQSADKLLEVVAIHNAKVAEVETLKKVAVVEYAMLYGIACLSC